MTSTNLWMFFAAFTALQVVLSSFGASQDKAYKRAKRIINGETAFPGEFPYLVGVYGKPAPPASVLTDATFCSGVIIGERWVLTTAFCVHDLLRSPYRPTQVFVQTGKYHGAYFKASPHSKFVSVAEVYIHPKYNTSMYPNDVAVLKLTEDVEWNSRVAKVELDFGMELPETATVVGWGRTEAEGRSSVPRKLNVMVRQDSICTYIYGVDIDAKNSICATEKGGKGTACDGDLGSPLAAEGKVIGLFQKSVDSVNGSCVASYPSLYLKVPFYVAWIQSVCDCLGSQ